MLAVVVNSEESKSSTEDKTTLTSSLSSSSSENKQQSKRGAPNTIYGSPQQLSTGFTPLTSNYPNVNGYVGGGSPHQAYAPAAPSPVQNVHGKTSYNAAGVYPLQGGVKYATYPQQTGYSGSVQYPRVSYLHPMNPYAQYPQVSYASQPGITYVNTPSYVQAQSTYNYPSVAQPIVNTQYHSQPLPVNHYLTPSSFQPLNPVVHATPVASIAPSTTYHQQAAYQPTYHQNPQVNKVAVQQPAIYHQQPAIFHQQPTIYPQQPNYYHPSSYQPSSYQPSSYQPASYQPSSYQPSSYQPNNYQGSSYQPNYPVTKHLTPSVAPAPVPTIITSKPTALLSPLPSTGPSNEHGQQGGAVSYSSYSSEPSQNKALSASQIATQPQQHQLYYQQPQQQQPIYTYNKQFQYANVQPNYYANSGAVHYGSQLVQQPQPYAHINKNAYTPTTYAQPTAPALIATSSSSTPLQQQKIIYH
ncbi:unnamed protein product [Diamesa tonsa]